MVVRRTLPRVRELKRDLSKQAGSQACRTLPRVRELKLEEGQDHGARFPSHPSQGA